MLQHLALGLCLNLVAVSAQDPPAQDPPPPTPEPTTSQEPLASGPVLGSPLLPVRVYRESSEGEGVELDAAAAIGKGAGAFLFVHDLSRNTAPMIRGFDAIGAELGERGFQAWCVRLADDRTAAERQLRAVNGSLKLNRPIVLGLDGAEGPGSYALNRRCTLTLVAVKNGQIIGTKGYTDTGQNDVPALRRMMTTVAGPPPSLEERRAAIAARLPQEVEALRALAIEQELQLADLRKEIARLKQERGEGMRRNNAPRRGNQRMRASAGTGARAGNTPATTEVPEAAKERFPGKAPTDSELTSLLRSFIRKDASAQRADEILQAIRERAAKSAELRAESLAMFERILHFGDHYGTEHARKIARAYLEQGKK